MPLRSPAQQPGAPAGRTASSQGTGRAFVKDDSVAASPHLSCPLLIESWSSSTSCRERLRSSWMPVSTPAPKSMHITGEAFPCRRPAHIECGCTTPARRAGDCPLPTAPPGAVARPRYPALP
jgi:hypothetical protein